LPSAVEVGVDEWGRPTWVVESDDGPAGRRDDGQNDGPADRWEGGGAERGTVGADGSGSGGPPGGGDGRRVEEVVEVWVVEDEWWRAPIHRRYVEVVLEGGAHVVLFEDLTSGEWFMQQP
ncbi:MAG: hypothetical protein OEY20_13070, partial [Gemmatimonadota bacterium]|nr:hypothetical protein [Gemmatimonadota bacterium]